MLYPNQFARDEASGELSATHRNFALAEAHRLRLEQELGTDVYMERRNLKGEYSQRGHQFTYYWQEDYEVLDITGDLEGDTR